MYKPSTSLVITYFRTYLSIYETYFLHNWLPRWNKISTQLRFIHNWVIMGIQWMVGWWVLGHCGQENLTQGMLLSFDHPSGSWSRAKVSEKFHRHANLIIFLDHIKQGWIVGGLPWNYAWPQFHNPGCFKIVKKGCICSDKHFCIWINNA
jgi:hypothetical protein